MAAVSNLSRRDFIIGCGAAASLLLRVSSSVAAVTGTQHPADFRLLDEAWEFRRGPLTPTEAAAASEEWVPVNLPHCVNERDACDPDVPYFRGQAWYRLRLSVHNPYAGGRTLLHFQGAGQTTTVWANQSLLGTHIGGYDEFAVDLTHSLRRGQPQLLDLLVCCDNAPDLDRSPSELSDFCLYGGLYRHVHLVYLPAVSLDAVHVLPSAQAHGPADVKVMARLYHPVADEATFQIATEILDPEGRSIHRETRTKPAWIDLHEVASLPISEPLRWSPETPCLYRCIVTVTTAVGTSRVEQTFGIRHFEFPEGGPFFLNGQRVLLRGTQRHADHAGVAAAMSDEQVRQEMNLIREMGANFIRLAHYQQDRLVLQLCDQLGLMVWEEAPWCRAGSGTEAWQTNTRMQLSNMIDQHINHPSIIFWGLANEVDWPGEKPRIDKPAIRTFMAEMHALAKQLDSSRLTACRRCDFASDIPDVYSPSIWAGWYRGSYREYEASLREEHAKVKRFLHVEWGADSQAGRHSEDPYAALAHLATGIGTDERGSDYLRTGSTGRASTDGDWSETYACDLFDWYLKTQESLPWLSGTAQWIFKDFASPLRADSPVPRVNQKGVVGRDLKKKESYAVFQSYWTTLPMIRIYGHSWPRRWGTAGQGRLVRVYSNCASAELFLNSRSLGSKTRDSQDFPCAGLRWNVVFQQDLNHLRAVGRTADGRYVEDALELRYQTGPWGRPATLRLAKLSHDEDIITVQAELFDASGVPCLDARNVVRFASSGATLIDNLGTVHGSRVVELCNGRAEISLRRQAAGSLTVSSEGIAATSLAFQ